MIAQDRWLLNNIIIMTGVENYRGAGGHAPSLFSFPYNVHMHSLSLCLLYQLVSKQVSLADI